MTGSIIGKVFERLTVLKQEGRYKNGTKLYLCQCECGGQATTSACHLNQGSVKSCGCLMKEIASKNGKLGSINIEIGTIFGRLEVIEKSISKKYGVYWKCICQCGNEKNILGTSLRRGNTKSCGCLAIESVKNNISKNRKNGWETEINNKKSKCKHHKIEFSLSIDEFKHFSLLECFYCGKPPYQICRSSLLREQNILRNGIDRIDSGKGYVSNNVVSCCERCNISKMNKTINEFILETTQRYECLKKKGLIK